MQLGDVEKIRELLIRDTYNRPGNGDYVVLRAAIGIQSRIVAAQGNAGEAISMLANALSALPKHAPARLRQNREVYRLSFRKAL